MKAAAAIQRTILACVLLAGAGCGGGPLDPTPPPPPPPPPNSPPAITALAAARPRVEVGEGVRLTATVTDAETPVQQLVFEWTASAAGEFQGSASEVTWRPASDLMTPAQVEIRLTVIERYTVARENRVSSTVTVHVNNSLREVTNLALTFLNDFANSSNSPEYCVRNFTDSCRGKAAELSDIQQDRQKYIITSSSVRVEHVDITAARDTAYIYAPCTFVSVRRDTGQPLPTSAGICALTAVYEPYRWWLCTSNFCNSYAACFPTPQISGFVRGLRQ